MLPSCETASRGLADWQASSVTLTKFSGNFLFFFMRVSRSKQTWYNLYIILLDYHCELSRCSTPLTKSLYETKLAFIDGHGF